jgi:hypothetical protein
MSKRLAKYLAELAVDPKKVAELKRAPEKAMAKAKLSADEKKVLRTADTKQLRDILVRHKPEAEKQAAVIVVTIF